MKRTSFLLRSLQGALDFNLEQDPYAVVGNGDGPHGIVAALTPPPGSVQEALDEDSMMGALDKLEDAAAEYRGEA
jgi:hypothetical protein